MSTDWMDMVAMLRERLRDAEHDDLVALATWSLHRDGTVRIVQLGDIATLAAAVGDDSSLETVGDC